MCWSDSDGYDPHEDEWVVDASTGELRPFYPAKGYYDEDGNYVLHNDPDKPPFTSGGSYD